jgi:hypothetical protein
MKLFVDTRENGTMMPRRWLDHKSSARWTPISRNLQANPISFAMYLAQQLSFIPGASLRTLTDS